MLEKNPGLDVKTATMYTNAYTLQSIIWLIPEGETEGGRGGQNVLCDPLEWQ